MDKMMIRSFIYLDDWFFSLDLRKYLREVYIKAANTAIIYNKIFSEKLVCSVLYTAKDALAIIIISQTISKTNGNF
jgi:hypothetical protein